MVEERGEGGVTQEGVDGTKRRGRRCLGYSGEGRTS